MLGADFSVQPANCQPRYDVIQDVIIIYKDIFDSLRGSLTQELNKTEKFNQGKPR